MALGQLALGVGSARHGAETREPAVAEAISNAADAEGVQVARPLLTAGITRTAVEGGAGIRAADAGPVAPQQADPAVPTKRGPVGAVVCARRARAAEGVPEVDRRCG